MPAKMAPSGQGGQAQLHFIKPLAYSLLNLVSTLVPLPHSRVAWIKPAAPPSCPVTAQVSASGIVFANKSVFQHYDYKFTYALTLIHTLTTLVGMRLFAYYGAFTAKLLPARATAPLAAAYVGYIVLCNLNLKINSVSFYQVLTAAVLMQDPSNRVDLWDRERCGDGKYFHIEPCAVGQITKIAVAPAVLGIEYVLFRKTASLRVMASIALVCLGVTAATVTDERVGTSGLGGLLVGAGAVGATALYQVPHHP